MCKKEKGILIWGKHGITRMPDITKIPKIPGLGLMNIPAVRDAINCAQEQENQEQKDRSLKRKERNGFIN